MKYWKYAIGPGITFGPLFMTNIAGKGRGSSDFIFLGVLMVVASLVFMWKTLERQAVEIEQLKKLIGAPSDVTSASKPTI